MNVVQVIVFDKKSYEWISDTLEVEKFPNIVFIRFY